LRRASETDLARVRELYEAFHAEATPEAPAHVDPAPRLRAGRIWLWVDATGQPLSLAARNRELPHGACIGPVYTPPEHRGRGYATALVAGLSQAILDEGKTYACLFTDLANPTSNAIYPKVGYRPVADTSVWRFV
jgi:predicted GNAT family acetyltransferase